jgi:iron complex transport system substrate-binding protein
MTEILVALGLGDRIVSVTSFCDFSVETKKKPKIGGISNSSLEAVVSLKPEIVVMTTDGNPKQFEEMLRLLNINSYVFKMWRISEVAVGEGDWDSARE